VNWRHLQTFVWLRWRLAANHWRRAGSLNAALMIAVVVCVLVLAVPLGLGSFALGLYMIPDAKPDQLMLAWDGLIVGFLVFWAIGVMAELQRDEALPLSKFLHLPVSVDGAFLINYLSSLIRLSLFVFVPVMLGFALALVYVRGVEQLPVLPSLAAFLLMVTAPTYQFQGWLASLMSNPRRRRTVIVTATMVFILLCQLPNLLNLYIPRMAREQAARSVVQRDELVKLQKAFEAKEIDSEEYARRSQELIDRIVSGSQRTSAEGPERLARVVRIANTVLPVGWLPLGVGAAAEGRILPSLLGLAGMTLIGAGCLWRAYRSTVRQYQGEGSNREGRVAARPESSDGRPGNRLLEMSLPGVSEPASAVALGGLRSLLRSPEAKMSLLSPVIMAGVFGSMMLNGRQGMPEPVRPFIGVGAIAMVFFGLAQLMVNQFGVDRDGFRVFVLCAAPRRDILLGKNLAIAPVAVVLAAIMLVVVQILYPMRLDHALSMIPQFISMYLVFCFIANLFSIYVPVYIAPGTLRPANPTMTSVLLQTAMLLVVFPLCQSLTLIPLVAELVLNALGVAGRVPVCLLLSLVGCAAAVALYRLSLDWLGDRLQEREQLMLETLTNRVL
jgi:ABC-2 type transport system permease protein